MSERKYKYYLYDWDGLLAQTLELWLEIYQDVFGQYGVKPSTREIFRHHGDWEIARHFGIKDVGTSMGKIIGATQIKLEKVPLYEGAKETVGTSSDAGINALVSSNTRYVLERELGYHGLTGYFDVIVSADDVNSHKPHPEGINNALAQLGANKAEAIMAGDSHKDIDAATNAGIDSVLFFPPSHERYYDLAELRRHQPTYVARDYKQLQEVLTGTKTQ